MKNFAQMNLLEAEGSLPLLYPATEKYKSDAAVIECGDQDTFLENLKDLASRTQWEATDVYQLHFEKRNWESVDPEKDPAGYDTAAYGTQLFVNLNGVMRPVRECGQPTLFKKLGVNCPAINVIKPEEKADWLNDITETEEYGTKKLMVPLVDGKVNAFLSEKYVYVPSDKVVASTINTLDRLEKNQSRAFKGTVTYAMSYGEWTLNEKLHSAQVPVLDGADQLVTVRTSDAGYSSIAFGAAIRVRVGGCETYYPLMTPISFDHTGRVEELVKDVFTTLKDEFLRDKASLESLFDIDIKHPRGCLINVGRMCGFSRSAVRALADENELDNMTHDDAFGLYTILCAMIKPEDDLQKQLRTQGDVLKALHCHWEDFDKPEGDDD